MVPAIRRPCPRLVPGSTPSCRPGEEAAHRWTGRSPTVEGLGALLRDPVVEVVAAVEDPAAEAEAAGAGAEVSPGAQGGDGSRLEERRGGEECRSRWGP